MEVYTFPSFANIVSLMLEPHVDVGLWLVVLTLCQYLTYTGLSRRSSKTRCQICIYVKRPSKILFESFGEELRFFAGKRTSTSTWRSGHRHRQSPPPSSPSTLQQPESTPHPKQPENGEIRRDLPDPFETIRPKSSVLAPIRSELTPPARSAASSAPTQAKSVSKKGRNQDNSDGPTRPAVARG